MIWLIGSGGMAVDYANVLQAQNIQMLVIGRGASSAEKFSSNTGLAVIGGGLDSFLSTTPELADAVIVSVGVEQLAATTFTLLNYGIKKILVEKPAGLNALEIAQVCELAEQKRANVFVAYNRRFFSSVLAAEKIIAADGGVTSFNFELTEWGHVISNLEKADGVLANWFLANTTHVIDMAFFLGGKPQQLSAFTSGGNNWHPAATNFSGAGVSDTKALFSYQGNWQSPGRWSVEILTGKHRLIFRPMEQLKVQKVGSVIEENYEIDDSLDSEYKPGLYLQVEDFLSGRHERLCSIKEQLANSVFYSKMAGYTK